MLVTASLASVPFEGNKTAQGKYFARKREVKKSYLVILRIISFSMLNLSRR